MSSPPVVDVRNLSVALAQDGTDYYLTRDISFSIDEGEVLAIVGESGSGKSVTALSLMQLLGRELSIRSGEILFRTKDDTTTDIAMLGRRGSRIETIRGGEIGMVFQEPMSSFSPIHTIGRQIAEVAEVHEGLNRRQARQRAEELMAKVGFPDPARAFDSYPDAFSGGMRQRAMIARSLMCKPRLLIADEPTTALDVTIQAQILELLLSLKQELGMAILFITHNMGIVAQIADRLAIMYSGRIVESGPVRDVFQSPQHPYTRALLNAVPRMEDIKKGRRLAPIPGNVPSIFNPPTGCGFLPRCVMAEAGRCDIAPVRQGRIGRQSVLCSVLADKEAVS